MTLAEFLAEVIDKLERSSIDYMIGGSVASSIYGEPRTTRDIEIVVEVSASSLRNLFADFDRDLVYVDEPDADEEILGGRMFNLLDLQGGWKVDLVIRKDRPFSKVEFGRRQQFLVLGVPAMVASVEDVLLTKLEWAKLSGSARQVDDALGIVAVQQSGLDLPYLRKWATELDVSELLERVLTGQRLAPNGLRAW